ncbi:hypothetical protein [Anaeroarcus burkinensis]|uniref:hypothetical protein n=1 Tax=Anaeroarcus burkinensis TaxID=82376 RepID=UPI001AEC2C00|nr:hypothetical protein [Anaeroarcus burkinensis]
MAKQMNIHIRHIRTYIEGLVKHGFIEVSEPATKQNGKKGAVTITLTTSDQYYVILPLPVMLDETIPKTYRQYYGRLKRIINLHTFTTFKSPTELQQHLGCNVKTYREFMKYMKNIKIDEHALILNETNESEYKTIMEYEQYVATDHKNNETEIKRAIRKHNRVSQDEGYSNIL